MRSWHHESIFVVLAEAELAMETSMGCTVLTIIAMLQVMVAPPMAGQVGSNVPSVAAATAATAAAIAAIEREPEPQLIQNQ